MGTLRGDLELYLRKWLYYERNRRPDRRWRLRWHMARRESFLRFPVEGNLLEALDEGRAEIGRWTAIEPGCWFSLYPETARMSIGAFSFLNRGVMIAATDEVTIGDFAMLGNRCFVSDGNHRFDDPAKPVPWQGFTSKGPVRIGSNCWLGVNCAVTSGVTIGDRVVVGANSVVTRDLPSHVVAAGAPARIIREIEAVGPDAEPQPPTL